MATRSLAVTITNNRAEGVGNPDPTAAVTLVDTAGASALLMVTTTVAANIATLVADGASPTQGHVNTLNTNWGVLLGLINTAKTDIAAAKTSVDAAGLGSDAAFSYNDTNVTTITQKRNIITVIAQWLGLPGA